MAFFVKHYLEEKSRTPLKILDIGSQDVNGTFRPLFDKPGWVYQGLDIVVGDNVDIVVKKFYHWKEVQSSSFDVAISGSALEHIEYFWITIMEVARVLKPEGLFCLIVPSSGPEHKYPIDCWRFFPDGLRALARYAFLDIIDAHLASERTIEPINADQWNDCVLIAKKMKLPFFTQMQLITKRYLLRKF